jgi:hypothetical protein
MLLSVSIKIDKPLVVESLVIEREPMSRATEDEKILCPHCLRTATNGIKCKGICVADSEY